MREITSRRLKEVKKWVKLVYERDNYQCQKCGSKERLQAHHIIEWDEAPHLRVELSNGICWCQSCHSKHHNTGRVKTQEEIRKCQETRKGYRHSKETIEKQKLNAGRPKGIPMEEWQKELYRRMFSGRKTSEQTKEKQRLNAGRPKGIAMKEEEKARRRLYFSERKFLLNPIAGKRNWVKIEDIK